jgi:NAD(P)-dependent dehydrogenase (short-subunit alcohol dehydrogenase family)
MSKVAIVTGSSSGIGLEAAADLAAKGYEVVYACRSKERAEAAMAQAVKRCPSAKTVFIELDTGSMDSVKEFAKAFSAKYDRLDVLINNAGCGYFKRDQRTTKDGLEAFFATNYGGPWLLTNKLLELLKKSKGRVVNVTSIEHWEGSYNFEKVTEKTGNNSYATSKLMLMLMAWQLNSLGVQGIAVSPGAVNSGIWWYLRGFRKFCMKIFQAMFFLTPKQGSDPLVFAATQEDLPANCYVTPYKQYGMCPYHSDMLGPFNGPTIGKPCPKATKSESWKELWEFTEKKLKPFM